MELDFFKAEHDALLDLRTQMLDAMDGDPNLLTIIRARMSRLLVAHLAKEDHHLYPWLKRSPNAATALCAARFEAEMGDLAKVWAAMMSDWPDARILRDQTGYGRIMRPILDALERRIESEERELYPLAASMPDVDDGRSNDAAA